MQSATSASPHPIGPTSPSETPHTNIFSQHHPRKRWHGLPHFPDSASSSTGELNRVGNTTRFNFTRQAGLPKLSSKSSTLDSDSSGPEPRSLTPSEVDGEYITDIEEADADMKVEEVEETEDEGSNSDFEVEEMRSSDIEPDSDAEPIEARRPDAFEDAEWTHSHIQRRSSGISSQIDPIIVNQFRNLDCSAPADDNSEDEEVMDATNAFLQNKKREKSERRKRWSSTSLKRGITESLGSGSDEEDRDVRREDAMEVSGNEMSGRRLRRKVGDRVSLSPEDIPAPIIEETNEGNGPAGMTIADGASDMAEVMDIDGEA